MEREKLTFSTLRSPHWMSMTEPGLAGTTAVASWAFKRKVQVAVVCTHYGAGWRFLGGTIHDEFCDMAEGSGREKEEWE